MKENRFIKFSSQEEQPISSVLQPGRKPSFSSAPTRCETQFFRIKKKILREYNKNLVYILINSLLIY